MVSYKIKFGTVPSSEVTKSNFSGTELSNSASKILKQATDSKNLVSESSTRDFGTK